MKNWISVSVIALAAVASVQGQGRRGFDRHPRWESIPPLLQRAIQAQPNLRYTGTYTTEFKQGGKTVRHQEYITRDGAWYRIDFPTDSQFAGQVIVENNLNRWHYHPIPNEILQQPPRHGEAWEKVANLAANRKFILTTAPGEVIAGMRTEQLQVSDLGGNTLQRLFIEPTSGVIMKRQLFDLVGTQIGFFEFSQIDLNPRIDPATFQIRRKDAKVVTPLMQLERVSRRKGFELRYLPPVSGYMLEGATPRNFAGVEGLVQTYLNGKLRLWVYLLKAPVDADRLRAGAGKNLHLYSFEANGLTIVLMGGVDERALARLAGMMTTGTATLGH